MTTYLVIGRNLTGCVLDVGIYQTDMDAAEREYDSRYGALGYRRDPVRDDGSPTRVETQIPRPRRRRGNANP